METNDNNVNKEPPSDGSRKKAKAKKGAKTSGAAAVAVVLDAPARAGHGPATVPLSQAKMELELELSAILRGAFAFAGASFSSAPSTSTWYLVSASYHVPGAVESERTAPERHLRDHPILLLPSVVMALVLVESLLLRSRSSTGSSRFPDSLMSDSRAGRVRIQ